MLSELFEGSATPRSNSALTRIFPEQPPTGSPEWRVAQVKAYGPPELRRYLDTEPGKDLSAGYIQAQEGRPVAQVLSLRDWINGEIDWAAGELARRASHD